MRSKSISMSSSTSPWKEATPPLPPTTPRKLKQTTSMADMKGSISKGNRWLKRFRSKGGDGDFDFGCAGNCDDFFFEESSPAPREETVEYSPPLRTAPPAYADAFPIPARQQQDVRAAERRREEERAVEAALFYMTSEKRVPPTSSAPPPLRPVRSSSKLALEFYHHTQERTITLSNKTSGTNIEYLEPSSPIETRSRSSTQSSHTVASSRDSLPSYRSDPPSPMPSSRRPSLVPINMPALPAIPDSDDTPRPYAFI